MATFPPVGDLERDAALDRIARRHRVHDDPRWSEAGSEARDVLDYLRTNRSRLPHQLRADDAWDELVLSAWVYWDERRRERELLRHALTAGLSLREVGAFVGLHTGQGLRDYLDSLEARLHEHHQITRETRPPCPSSDAAGPDLLSPADDGPAGDPAGTNAVGTSAVGSTEPGRYVPRHSRNPYLRFKGRPRAVRNADGRFSRIRRAAAAARPARQVWIEHHRQRIQAVAGKLIDEAARLGFAADTAMSDDEPGLGDYLEWIREDIGTGIDHGTFGSIGLVLGVLRAEKTVTDRAPNHGIHRAMAAADRLRAEYAALTPTRTTD